MCRLHLSRAISIPKHETIDIIDFPHYFVTDIEGSNATSRYFSKEGLECFIIA